MKFIVDTMLGTLAKWLRIMGFDTLYDKHFSDDDLFFKAFLENRILLTRDRELSKRVGAQQCFYIKETVLKDQLKEVVEKYDLDSEKNLLSRCVVCNEPIFRIDKAKVKGRVPAFVFDTVDEFYYCRTCDKIYWAGSHVKHIREFLKNMKGKNQ